MNIHSNNFDSLRQEFHKTSNSMKLLVQSYDSSIRAHRKGFALSMRVERETPNLSIEKQIGGVFRTKVLQGASDILETLIKLRQPK